MAHTPFLKAAVAQTRTFWRRTISLEGRRPHRRLGRRLEEVAKAVGGGYWQLQMALKLALRVRDMAAGRRLGALEGGYLPPIPMHRCGGG